MPKYPMKLQDIILKAFRDGGGPGGQAKNKTENCIRATHKPTGLVAEAKSERSQHANRENALKLLQAKLDKLLEEQINKDLKNSYDLKDEATFGSQVRTYRLCGSEQTTIDHRTGITQQTKSTLNGNLDNFIMASLKDGETISGGNI